ncbi:hypothetical protein G7B40_030290 [Aetokthonos hydrillicola Thurmond2011]|jgi:hypothetical protein|uniref:Uncharacterized protein n=1 Tax=Aetokthonos hydrillicola Thurmond2011 TaxID=2712845 RepID=A0AAP5IGK8_9CYAN|nr:hypothetical protein [Aetokthonos hydrillicola]MBO3459872.1 hypothetical protein [Aetokthonos hydrillicola CCALA 1050]MBW4583988.1 hypothetical protein [Aetokthonos hydrillicola CCALA 1050]MDR9898815.1 hypothetical protein [Aetokthonos hydrillicola Thurmond2011]
MKSLTPELIRAITPMFLATIGAVIGVAVLVSPKITDAKWSAGLGLAGTAIAGAAGLAQSSKSEPDFSVSKQGDNLKVETPNSEPADRH